MSLIVTVVIPLVVGVKIVRRDQGFKIRARSIVPGRQRWDIGAILNQPSVAEVLEAELRASPEVAVVRANSVTGRLLIYHDTALNGEEVGQRVRKAARQAMAFRRSVRPTACPALERLQRHHDVAENLDPRLSQTHEGQLAEINSGGAIEIADDERKLNRYIAAAAVSMGMAIVGFLYPPLFPLTVASAVCAGMRIFKNGYKALVRERELRLDVVGSLYLVCAFIGGFYFPASFGLFAYYLSEKLVLITQDRSQQSLINIFGEQPRTVWQRVDDVEVEVPLHCVQAGDTLVVEAGQLITVNGVIT